ncbi:DUF5753 domain-containing protein [Streptomyces prunicolor]|uniref:DUF5753 domain-containing protein n=1 Tax=Streptomyces prunicolor TaxID=67348 RepID=UPI00342F94BC
MGAAATDRLTALDTASEGLRVWNPMLIPGLLQTTLYAVAAIKSRTPSLSDEEAALRMQSRLFRSENFLRLMGDENGQAHAWFVMGEAALTQSVTTTDFHAHQLEHLLAIMDRYPRIKVRVLPDDASTAGNMEPFSVHALANGPRVGHLETIVGGWYTTRSEDVTRLYSAFAVLGKWALEPWETRRVIEACLTECRAKSGEAPDSSSPHTATPTVACSLPALPAAPSQ